MMVRYIVDGNKLELAIDNRDTMDPEKFVIEFRYLLDSERRSLVRGIEIGQRWDDIPIHLFQTKEECIYYIKGYVINAYESISEGSDI